MHVAVSWNLCSKAGNSAQEPVGPERTLDTATVIRESIEVKFVTRADCFITKVAYLIIFVTFKNHFESKLSRKSLLSSISSFLGSDEICAAVSIFWSFQLLKWHFIYVLTYKHFHVFCPIAAIKKVSAGNDYLCWGDLFWPWPCPSL